MFFEVPVTMYVMVYLEVKLIPFIKNLKMVLCKG